MRAAITRNAVRMAGLAMLTAVTGSVEEHAGQTLLSPCEAAHALAVSDRTIHRWISHGDLPAVRVGGRYRITREAVASMIRPAHEGDA
jgi:excisionase family DNA binding protein